MESHAEGLVDAWVNWSADISVDVDTSADASSSQKGNTVVSLAGTGPLETLAFQHPNPLLSLKHGWEPAKKAQGPKTRMPEVWLANLDPRLAPGMLFTSRTKWTRLVHPSVLTGHVPPPARAPWPCFVV